MSGRKRSCRELSQLVQPSCFYLEPTEPFQWHDMFNNTLPVDIEVGCGKGLFLVSAATQYPERNFFAIELARKYALWSAYRVMRLGLENVRVARADARELLRDRVPENSVTVLHVYFPDPWWKKRHKKRRLFNPQFVDSAARVLKPAGELRFASDVEEYFQLIWHLAQRHPAFVPLPVPATRPPENDMDYLTNFERKYRKEGRRVYRTHFVKLDAS